MIDLSRALGRLLGRSPQPPPTATFGFAVVGLGRIAEHFLKGLRDSPQARVTALVSGDAGKAERMARQYDVPHTCGYGAIDTLRDRTDVHAVYLALPVSMHREFTAHAAMAGKHVLVEKPMASTAEDCRAMIADCRAAGVLLSVAYRCPYDPMHQRARQLLRSGALGTVQRMESSFGFALSPEDWRRNGALGGGGSLYDVGIYSLNAARYFTGAEPVSESAQATTDANGLEMSVNWVSRFPSGVEAVCRSSYLERFPGDFSIQGTSGNLRLDPAFSHREPVRLRGTVTDPATGVSTTLDESCPKDMPSHFRLEAEALAQSATTGATLPTPGEDGLRDLEAMERIYAAAGVTVARACDAAGDSCA